jgi:hypothetical protein
LIGLAIQVNGEAWNDGYGNFEINQARADFPVFRQPGNTSCHGQVTVKPGIQQYPAIYFNP